MKLAKINSVYTINMNLLEIIVKISKINLNSSEISGLHNLHVFNIICRILCTRIGYVSSTNFTATKIQSWINSTIVEVILF